MAAFCLTKEAIQKFKQALVDREIDPVKLTEMASQDRSTFFEKYVGKENAKQVNALFESKLLLKNQKAGYISWAKKVSGITEPARRDLISRIEKMDTFLNPEDEKSFLHDLASQKLGTDVTQDEAKQIFDLSQKIQETRKPLDDNPKDVNAQIEYGKSLYDMQTYLDDIKPKGKHVIANLVNAPRALVASLDFVSAPFRHGFFAMSHPEWIQNYAQIPRLVLRESAFRARMGKIYGSPYYDALMKGGLKITKIGGDLSKEEEEFASNLLNKFPLVAGSKRGYAGFLNGLRMDIAVKMMKAAEVRGDNVGLGSKVVKDISTAINNITGSGGLGRFESAAPEINMVFFSPRMQVARFNILNPYTYIDPKTTMQSRMLMARSLLGSTAIATTALLLAQAGGLQVGTDPNKTDFGEIHIGNLTIDTTGGNRVLATLISRIISGKYVSSSGNTTQIGVGNYKPLTRMDLLTSFIVGKLAPGVASTLGDFLTEANGVNPYGQKVDIPTEIEKQLTPLNITNGMDIFGADPSNTTLGVALGLFGLPVEAHGTNANSNNWSTTTSTKLLQFKAKVGDTTFNTANTKFNTLYNDWSQKTIKDPSYQNLTDAQKNSLILSAKAKIESQVLKEYNFTYRENEQTRLQNKRALNEFSPQ